MSKAELRATLQAQYNTRDLDALVDDAVEKILALKQLELAQTVADYTPLKDEIPFIAPLRAQHPEKTWYAIARTANVHTTLAEIKRLTSPMLVIVPARAVDTQGNRLGRGGGFYDELLSALKELGVDFMSVSVVPDFAVLDEIPTEAHDVPVDTIVSAHAL